MSKIILRGGAELENPLELVLEFLEAYSSNEAYDSSGPASFDEGGPQELCEHMRLRSGMRYRAAASHRKEWRLAYRGLRLDR
jgi:hypothetical protein